MRLLDQGICSKENTTTTIAIWNTTTLEYFDVELEAKIIQKSSKSTVAQLDILYFAKRG